MQIAQQPTKKILTATLIGKELDLAVAKCEGYTITTDGINILVDVAGRLMAVGPSKTPSARSSAYSPSTDGGQGQAIIERQRISLSAFLKSEDWSAFTYTEDVVMQFRNTGPTHLIAAMRCYVAMKLGAEVEAMQAMGACTWR